MSDPEVRKEHRLKLPFLEISVETLEAPPDDGVVDAGPTGARLQIPLWLFVLPFLIMLAVRMIGLLFYDWSIYSGHWPWWFSVLFVVALASLFLGGLLNRPDRKENDGA